MTPTNTTPDTGGIPDFLKADLAKTGPKAKPAATAGSNTATKPAKAAAPATTKKAKSAKSAEQRAEDKAKRDSGSIIPAKYKKKYGATAGTCGDRLALALKEATTTKNEDGRPCLDVEALFAIAKANEVDPKPYAKMNNGQKRMNIANKLRGVLLDGNDVKIGTTVLKGKAGLTKSPTVIAKQAEAIAA